MLEGSCPASFALNNPLKDVRLDSDVAREAGVATDLRTSLDTPERARKQLGLGGARQAES